MHLLMNQAARLKEIEQIAIDATTRRRQFQDNLAARGFDVLAAVGLMIRGRVRRVPNLHHEGRRVSGLFVPDGPYPEVLYEAYEPRRRQRFTIGHELGHYYLDPHAAPVCEPSEVDKDSDSTDEVQDVRESEADAFASAFLIPADVLAEDLRQFGTCSAFLADLYDVSEPAIRRRLRTTKVLSL
jgi:hypothetical protein